VKTNATNLQQAVTPLNLRELRKAAGLRQEDLAALLGVKASQISRLESGKRRMSRAESALLQIHLRLATAASA
jgi:transcriptional regulator with XRE-family HTH domain